MDKLYDSETLLQVILVTGVIGGGAAFLAGRAIAQTWRPFWSVAVYMAMGSLIAAGVLALLKLKPDQPASITLLSSARS